MNVAYTEHYAAYRSSYDPVFLPANRCPGEETADLGDGFTLRTRSYEKKMKFAVGASEHELLNREGRVVYSWRNLDDDGEFAALVHHRNGRRYLLFRRELYGYSVLEIETGREFHFVPSESFPELGEAGQETFIWTGVSYDPVSGLLAASGCYWACPNGTVLMDFSDPMAERPWLDLHERVDPDYDLYDSVDLDRWDGEGGLYLRVFRNETRQYETLHLTAEELAL